jgi:hypothetical protein
MGETSDGLATPTIHVDHSYSPFFWTSAQIIFREARRITTVMTKLSTVLNTSVEIGSVPPMGVYVDMEELTQHNQSRSTISDRIQEKSVVYL